MVRRELASHGEIRDVHNGGYEGCAQRWGMRAVHNGEYEGGAQR